MGRNGNEVSDAPTNFIGVTQDSTNYFAMGFPEMINLTVSIRASVMVII